MMCKSKISFLALFILSIFSHPFAANAQVSLDSVRNDMYRILSEYSVNSDNRNLFSYTLYKGETLGKLEQLEQSLQAVNTTTREDELEKSVLWLDLKDKQADYTFKTYLLPFNAEGGFFFRTRRVPERTQISTQKDSEEYIAWMESAADYISYNQSLLEQGIEENIMRPKVIVNNIIGMIEKMLPSHSDSSMFFQPYLRLSADIPEKEKAKMIKTGRKAMEKSVVKAYKDLLEFLKTDYLSASPETVGISTSTNGKAYYEDRIRHFTTLPISADSVFNLGQAEVARIKALMEEVIQKAKFEGSFADFIAFLRTDEQFYPQTPKELLYYAAWLSKKAEGELTNLFSHLYETPFTVKPVPAHLAPNYTGGRYSGGGTSRAGEYWVNTYNLPSRTLYTLPALTLHEAVPGHHLQGAVAAENTEMSNYRRRYYISAFGEGWGLYSEFLGEEMGMYETPYDWFGRYTYEMWRACRLVVDVGMHYKGWTREQAVDFLKNNSALSIHEINTEIDRYIGWPGQAVSYKVGELTIKALRKKAEVALGEKFDIKEFHFRILRNGSIPLAEMEHEIMRYIEEMK